MARLWEEEFVEVAYDGASIVAEVELNMSLLTSQVNSCTIAVYKREDHPLVATLTEGDGGCARCICRGFSEEDHTVELLPRECSVLLLCDGGDDGADTGLAVIDALTAIVEDAAESSPVIALLDECGAIVAVHTDVNNRAATSCTSERAGSTCIGQLVDGGLNTACGVAATSARMASPSATEAVPSVLVRRGLGGADMNTAGGVGARKGAATPGV